jgi:DNA-binding CsgD family transcriptional regulator
MELLFPHLQMALNLRRKFLALETYASTLDSAFDATDVALILLDYRARVIRLNKSAEALLSAGQGLTIRGGYLQAAAAAEQDALKALIHRIGSGRRTGRICPGGSMLVTRLRRRPLALTAAPLIGFDTVHPPRAAIILFIYDPDASVRPPMDLLRKGYRLTAAEARLAVLLVQGASLSEVARICEVQVNTVRQQLKSVFRKTGTGHQAELIRLLMRTFLSN